MTMLRVRSLAKRYGPIQALAGLDLDVEAGEVLGLLGPNGAGKTTLASIVAGLRTADAGTVMIDGADALRHPRRVRHLVGFAPQEIGVYPTASVRENLRFFARLNGMDRRAADRELDRVAGRLGLTPLLDRRVQGLSGGQKRRLHAAAALVHRPRLVLLDEPTVGADVETRAMLLEAVAELARDGTAVVYTTHYLHELEVLGATVAVMEVGQLVARGSQADLVAQHAAAAVEVVLDGPAPPALAGWPGAEVHRDDVAARVRIPTSDPARTAAEVLASLDGDRRAVRSIDLVRPGLEAAYLALTGRRTADASTEEVHHALA
jgi:ABC-2 type transport system ATP-binding protein